MTTAYQLLIADVYELAGKSRRLSESDAAAMSTTAAQWHVLSVVSDVPATVPAIAMRLGTVRQAVQRIVHDLNAAGRVELTPNPHHRRSPMVTLTDAGRELLQELWAATTPRRAAAMEKAGVTDDELMAARAVIRRLIDALD